MELDSDIHPEISDSKHASSSPNTQSDISTDGDASLTQPSNTTSEKSSTAVDSMNSVSIEPKAKKRRKQSKPLKCQNVASADVEMPLDEIDIEKTVTDKVDNSITETKNNVENSQVVATIKDASENNENDFDKNVNTDTSSHKNILSHMTDMLFNNTFRGADLINQMVSRSKGISLADVNSSDSNDDALRNLDPKTMFPGLYPQMPPLLPLNSNDMVGELSKLTSVFSQLAELPAQFTPTTVTAIAGSNRSFITSSGVRVFNPEAYCELCEKEFCNKYFLKTHKANKHGVCSIDNVNTSFRTPYKALPYVPSVPPPGISQSTENNSQGPSDAYCNICQKSFCNKYFLKKHRLNIHGIIENCSETSPSMPSSIHVPVISTLSLNRIQGSDAKSENSLDFLGNDESKYVNMSLANIKNTMNGNPMSALLNFNGFNAASLNTLKNSTSIKGEGFLCELCNIEFCDKHYLESHKQNKHKGDSSPTDTQEFTSASENGKIENAEKVKTNDECSDFKNLMCAPCMKNFTSAESFQSHMFDTHGAMINDDEDGKFKKNQFNKITKSNTRVLSPHLKKSPNIPDNENSDSSTDPSFVYCSLCLNKFKDKNTLQVHFDTHHKLNDPYTQGNGLNNLKDSVCAKVPQFRCDTCPEQFMDKNAVSSHRLNLHGIISPLSESCVENDVLQEIENELLYASPEQGYPVDGSRYRKCRICHLEVRNSNFVKTHMLEVHSMDIEKLLADPSCNRKSAISCNMCDKIVSNKCLLKVHKLGIHGIDELNNHGQSVNSTSNEIVNNKANEQHHLSKSNHVGNPNESGNSVKDTFDNVNDYRLACEICGQKFPSKLHLQVHLVNKHVNNSESRITNLRELIGLSIANTEVLGFSPNSIPKMNGNSKEHMLNDTGCSCCSYINLDDTKYQGKYSCRMEGKMLMCQLCNNSYHINDYYQHHLSHQNIVSSEVKLKNPHEMLYHTHIESNRDLEMGNKMKQKPRKIKRFRCSKCDKPFRTRNKCLRHIQVMHKNKKGSVNVNDRHYTDSSPKKANATTFDSKDEQKAAFHSQPLSNDCSKPYSPNSEKKNFLGNEEHQHSAPMPVPYILPKNASDVIMQPFHLTEPKSEEMSKPDIFVPSLVYLPVSRKVSEPLTVAFTLTPA